MTELVLADLCRSCASGSESLVARYGGHGREAIALVNEARAAPSPHRVAGFLARSVLYLLIAVTFFVIVTLISASAH